MYGRIKVVAPDLGLWTFFDKFMVHGTQGCFSD